MTDTTAADSPPPRKPVLWAASSKKDLRELPKPVRQVFGQAIDDAQAGDKHPDAKPLHGFGGAGVLEVVEDYDGSTFRAVYTVTFPRVVFVLHVFQKKSKSGRKTPQADIDKIRKRLTDAEGHYAEWVEQQDARAEGGA